MEQPNIEHNGKKMYQIGCRRCQAGDFWKVFTDGIFFVAKCRCGHIVEINKKAVKDKPDNPQAIPLHFVN